MKKLIAMLNLATLSIASTTSLISCVSEEGVKKHHKKQYHKKSEQSDNEESEDSNNEVTIENMLDQLQDLKFTANLKANNINTIDDLISELNNREEIKAIINDYDFTITSEVEGNSILVQQMYQFKITLEDNQQEEESNQTSAIFEVTVAEKDSNQDDNNETKQGLVSIMNKIKNNLKTANLKANDTNTVLDLTNEVKGRIEELIQDKPVSYQLTINNNEQSISKLEEKSYQFNIELKSNASKEGEENSNNNSLSDNFSIAVEKVEVDLEQQQMMQQLEQLDQQIEVKLLKKVLIADGVSTYKDVKELIKADLIKLASTKNAVLKIEFINSIFKDDSELIYKIENPFEVKIELIAQNNKELSLSKVYKISAAEGLTKEYLKDQKDKDLKYNVIREVIKKLFANETFTDNISSLVNIKADGEHTVEDVISALNTLNNADVFDKKQDINKYKFHYSTSLSLTDPLIANQNLIIYVSVSDQQANQLFYNTKFNFKVLGEANLEQYERITEKITKYLNNKELDLSSHNELNADGKIQWQQTLNKIVKTNKIYEYFNLQPLGNNFRSENTNIVDFDIWLDPEKTAYLDNNYFTYNSEQKYVAVKLKIFKKGSTDLNFKEKNVDLKIRVGGFTDQQIYEKQEAAAKKLKELIDLEKFKWTDNYSFTSYIINQEHKDVRNMTYKNMIDYFLDITSVGDEILGYLNSNFLITAYKTNPEKLSINDYIFSIVNRDVENVTIEMNILPKGRKEWKNNVICNFSIMKDLKNIAGELQFQSNILFMKEFEKFWSKKIVISKKETINGKQITYGDLKENILEEIKSFTNKSPSYIKSIFENMREDFENISFLRGNSVVRWSDEYDPLLTEDKIISFGFEHSGARTIEDLIIKIVD